MYICNINVNIRNLYLAFLVQPMSIVKSKKITIFSQVWRDRSFIFYINKLMKQIRFIFLCILWWALSFKTVYCSVYLKSDIILKHTKNTCCNPNLPLIEKSQMVVYLGIYVVRGEENSAGKFLRVEDDI